ncbi:MAG: hypothetical protein AAFY82_00095 [Pseudomonadota bacterium]
MSNFLECIQNAIEEGTINQAEGDEIRKTFLRAREKHGGDNGAAAKDTVEMLRNNRDRQAKLDRLNALKAREISEEIQGFLDGSGRNNVAEYLQAKIEFLGQGQNLASSVEGRRKAIIGRAHGMMESVLWEFRQGASFRRSWGERPAKLSNLIKEAFGEDTKDSAAKRLAKAWTQTAEDLRQRFNRAGGDIKKLENWGLPQMHDARAVRAFIGKHGRQAYLDRLYRDVDASRMRGRDGEPISDAELRESLEIVLDNILTDGWANRVPKRRPFGRGSLANQRLEERFLVFKDASTWEAYQRDFGGGDPFVAMMGHISMMARDIAQLEVLGPNPRATLNWIEEIALSEAGKRTLDQPALLPASVKSQHAMDHVQKKIGRARSMWVHYMGEHNVPANEQFANAMANVRNVITSSTLGSAALSAIPTDPMFQGMARFFAGSSQGRALREMVKRFSSKSRRDAVRFGLVMETALNTFGQQARYAETFSGSAWSNHLASTVLEASALSPWTRAGRQGFMMGALFDLGAASKKKFDGLDAPLQRTLRRYGFTEADWDVIRASEKDDGAVNPLALEPSVGDKLLEFLNQESEYAVPSGSLRSRSLLIGDSRAGTAWGELRRSSAMFMSFGATVPMLWGYRIAQMIRSSDTARGAAYATALFVTLSLGGALAIQVKQLAAGRDPRDMTTPNFAGAAMLQGGGMGIWGDFLFADVNRFGRTLPLTAGGPVAEGADRFIKMTIGNVMKAAEGDEVNFLDDLRDFGQRYTPGGNIWYLRLAWERVFEDSLQKITDPEAEAAFRRKAQYYRRNFNQEFWWAPGDSEPERGPDFEAAAGGSR